ncbi:PEPxxWA-CTERM sorting domain-containing protein [Novosphingobium piscinae]|uniref:PEPxxWA-CTERM sorting domain-containing protein n=1 Tax=Novosphingobium piscinae TaxID=1507448 RepID=A0A7X1KQA8_9SPHN|nr:PEPxxWA-CTERM sorting domain-containing protein [Novosphingobium piscinae]MBC2669554.1 PEPxxWA-CTERM sorting domain-containing protein [Novosphingobium piscinae]
MKMTKVTRATLAVFATLMSGAAQAATVFESFPNYAASGDTPLNFCSSCTGAGAIFVSFNLAAAQTLDKSFVLVSTLASQADQAANPMTISIFTDGGDDLPSGGSSGAIVNPFLSQGFTNPTSVVPGGARTDGYANYVAEFALPNWNLAAGKYWIRFAGFSNLIPLFPTATPANSRAVGTDFLLEGRAITLNPPALSAGFSLNGVSSSVAGAVPEPSTWLTMIGGFALIGMAMRRQRMALACG